MSLINEALKKAQKLRSGDPAGTIAPMPGGTPRVTKRGEPRSTQQLVLIATGAVVLVVLSVVATFWFVNRTPAPKPASKPLAIKPADSSAPPPTIVAPAIKPPVIAPETPPTKSASAPVVVEQNPAATPATKAASTPSPAPPPVKPVAESPPLTPATTAPQSVATETAPAPSIQSAASVPTAPTPAAAAGPVATDPRVHAFVDAVKVAGIRSSGGDSRVLMNDRVFRVNDIVERNLGVRLTKVEASALTFTDSNGAIYVKNF